MPRSRATTERRFTMGFTDVFSDDDDDDRLTLTADEQELLAGIEDGQPQAAPR
ncbi:hypothetical protein GCM10009660_25580 [Catellatospora bangladeshensis]